MLATFNRKTLAPLVVEVSLAFWREASRTAFDLCGPPIQERMEIVKKIQPLAIQCQFCNERYELSIDDCIAAWNRK